MKSVHNYLVVLMALFIVSCNNKKDESQPSTNSHQVRLTFTESFLPQGDSMYVMISDAAGKLLAEKIQVGPGSVVFASTDSVTLTTLRAGIRSGYFVPAAISYYNITSGSYTFDSQDGLLGLAQVYPRNVPPLKSGCYTVISTGYSGAFVFEPAGSYTMGVHEGVTSCYVKLVKAEGDAVYNLFPGLAVDGSLTLDLSGMLPLERKTITTSPLEERFYMRLRGYPVASPSNQIGHFLDYYHLNSPVHQVEVCYPGTLFPCYETELWYYNDDGTLTLGQLSYGNIPDSFVPIQAGFEFVSTELPELKISTQGNYDLLACRWAYRMGEGLIAPRALWYCYAPSGKTSLRLPELSTDIARMFNLSVDSLRVISTSIFDLQEGFDYTQYLNRYVFGAPAQKYKIEERSFTRLISDQGNKQQETEPEEMPFFLNASEDGSRVGEQ